MSLTPRRRHASSAAQAPIASSDHANSEAAASANAPATRAARRGDASGHAASSPSTAYSASADVAPSSSTDGAVAVSSAASLARRSSSSSRPSAYASGAITAPPAMHSAASRPGVSIANASMTSSSPGGWPAACTGSAGTSSAKRSSKKPGPYRSAVSAGRYSFGPSNPSGSNTRDHPAVPSLVAPRASRRASVIAYAATANAAGGSVSSRGATQTASPSSAAATNAHAVACGSQRPTNGGNGSPSSRPSRRASHSPTATVTAIAANPAAGTSRARVLIELRDRRPQSPRDRCRPPPPGPVARRRHRVVTAACHPRVMVSRAAALLLLALMAGCGSATPGELPPAAEPASSPPPAAVLGGRVVQVGFKPEGVVADPTAGIFAVGVREPGELVLVEGETGAIVKRVPLPEPPRHLAFDGDRVLVPTEDADMLLRVSVPGGRVATAPAGREPHDAAAAGGRVFVADEFAHTLTVLHDQEPLTTIETALQPGGVTALDRGRS